MKNIFIFSFLTFVAFGCNSQAQKSPDSREVINTTDPTAKVIIETTPGDFTNVNVEQAAMAKDVVYLDVRTPEEIEKGMIPNAINIDFRSSSFDSEINKLDKDKTYVVYCRSGGRSARASKNMVGMGFKSVINMEGGYEEYKVAIQ